MELCDYKYAGPYIMKKQADMKALRKLSENSRKYYDMSFYLAKKFHLNTGMVKKTPTETADAILELIDGKDLCNGLWERCINACKEIFLLDDADGAMVIFYYYILNMPMSEIVNILHISKRSCWRHHGIAMDDLDYVLSLNA